MSVWCLRSVSSDADALASTMPVSCGSKVGGGLLQQVPGSYVAQLAEIVHLVELHIAFAQVLESFADEASEVRFGRGEYYLRLYIYLCFDLRLPCFVRCLPCFARWLL